MIRETVFTKTCSNCGVLFVLPEFGKEWGRFSDTEILQKIDNIKTDCPLCIITRSKLCLKN